MFGFQTLRSLGYRDLKDDARAKFDGLSTKIVNVAFTGALNCTHLCLQSDTSISRSICVCEILYSFGDREQLVTFWLQGTLGCTASHRGYVLAKTEIVLLLFFGFVVGFPRFTVVAEPGFDRAGQFPFW